MRNATIKKAIRQLIEMSSVASRTEFSESLPLMAWVTSSLSGVCSVLTGSVVGSSGGSVGGSVGGTVGGSVGGFVGGFVAGLVGDSVAGFAGSVPLEGGS